MISKGLGNNRNLDWTPYVGIDVPTYDIYRGTNANNMTLLASVSGNVSSYTDLNAAGNHFYQIAFTNPNDCDPAKAMNYGDSRSNLVSIEAEESEESTALAFTLYPNPATDELNLELSAEEGNVTIWSMVGAKVLEQVVGKQATLAVGHLIAGVYTITIKTGEGMSTQRFVKQ